MARRESASEPTSPRSPRNRQNGHRSAGRNGSVPNIPLSGFATPSLVSGMNGPSAAAGPRTMPSNHVPVLHTPAAHDVHYTESDQYTTTAAAGPDAAPLTSQAVAAFDHGTRAAGSYRRTVRDWVNEGHFVLGPETRPGSSAARTGVPSAASEVQPQPIVEAYGAASLCGVGGQFADLPARLLEHTLFEHTL